MTDSYNGVASLWPGFTTVAILVAFVLTVYQLYKHVQKILLNRKGDGFDAFSDGGRSTTYDRTPFIVNTNNNNNNLRNRRNSVSSQGSRLNREFVEAANEGETFEFDATELGSYANMYNYEEYSGDQRRRANERQAAAAAKAKATQHVPRQVFSSEELEQ